MKGLVFYRRFKPNTLSFLPRHLSSNGDSNDDELDRHTVTKGSMQNFLSNAKEKQKGPLDDKKVWTRAIKSRSSGAGDSVKSGRTRPTRRRRDDEDTDSDLPDSDDDIDEETRREIDLLANYDHETDLTGKNRDDYFMATESDDDLDKNTHLGDILAGIKEAEEVEEILQKEKEALSRALYESPGFYEEEFGGGDQDKGGGRRRKGQQMSEKEEQEGFQREMKEMERSALLNVEQGIAPEEASMLNDMDWVEEQAKKGLAPDNEELDSFDAFLGEILMEGVKTKDGSVRGILPVDENDPSWKNKKKRNRIPHPRTTKQLVRAVTPQISSVSEKTDGYQIASEVWAVLSKNPYYTQADKIEMCNYLAKEYDYIMSDEGLYDEDQLASLQAVNGGRDSHQKVYGTGWSNEMIESEMVWNDNFRPGIELIEEEQMKNQLIEEERRAQASFAEQEKTDWSVEAVVDEDELFK